MIADRKTQRRGAVACGHPATAAAAEAMLAEGGNAFDAVLAACCAATVAEPVLASLGGGGFLLAQPAGREPLLYDFFVQTPRRRGDPAQLDFRSEEHTSELQSLMRISYAVFCLKKKKK